MIYRGVYDPLSLLVRERARLNDDRRCRTLLRRSKGIAYFGDISYSSCSKLHTKGLGSVLGRLKPILPVRPCRMPKIINSCLRLAQVSCETPCGGAALLQSKPIQPPPLPKSIPRPAKSPHH